MQLPIPEMISNSLQHEINDMGVEDMYEVSTRQRNIITLPMKPGSYCKQNLMVVLSRNEVM